MEDDGLENLTIVAPPMPPPPPSGPPPLNSCDNYHDSNNTNFQQLEIHNDQPLTSLVDQTPQSSQCASQISYNATEALTVSIDEDTIASSPSYVTAENATPESTTNETLESSGKLQQNQKQQGQSQEQNQEEKEVKKSVLFDTVTVYHFTRSQGFSSIPTVGGATLGMKRKHFLRRKLSVDLYEEVRRRSRREILLKIRLDKRKKKEECDQLHCNSISSSTSSTSNTTTSSDSDDDSISDYSDISDAELESDSYIFLQPVGVRLRRSLLRASGVGRIDPKEKKECKAIRESRERGGCKCVNQCIPGLCECSLLGVNCHVDRVSFPCGCISAGCRNPHGRTEFDTERVKVHLFEILENQGIG